MQQYLKRVLKLDHSPWRKWVQQELIYVQTYVTPLKVVIDTNWFKAKALDPKTIVVTTYI